MRVTAIQIAAIARPVHAATQLRFSAGDATGRSARSDVGERNGPLITMGVPKSAGCVTQELMSPLVGPIPPCRRSTARHSRRRARWGIRGTVRHWVADLEAEARNAAMRYFHRKWTNTRPELCGSFSTRW